MIEPYVRPEIEEFSGSVTMRLVYDAIGEALREIDRQIEAVGPMAFEIALASRGYVKERTCKLDSFADVSFNVEYEVKGYDPGSCADYAALATCSACGAFVLIPPEYHRVSTYDGDELYSPYSFCPCCGAKVVDE